MAPPTKDRRPGFSRRAQYSLFLTYVLGVAGALVGGVLLALSTLNPQAFALVRSGVAEVTAPVSAILGAPVRWIVAVPDAIGTWINVHGDNARLTAELKALKPQIVQARQDALDNRSLRRLLAVRDRTPGVVATARIVSTTASSTRRIGLLNAGAWQDVEEGQAVRGGDGLIGRVLDTGANTARVLLLTDAESVVPVRRLSDGRPAIAVGRGTNVIELRSVETTDGRFRPGDIYVTSGSGGLFPPGIPVARALRSGADAVAALPFARPSVLDFAMVARAWMPPAPPAAPPTAAPPAGLPAPSPSTSPSATPAPSPTPTLRP